MKTTVNIRRKSRACWLGLPLVAVLMCALPGCTAGRVAVPNGRGVGAPPATTAQNLERLTQLHKRRGVRANDGEYMLGSGDVLALHAFDFEEMNRRVRVDGDGTITLPLLETVPVSGSTVSQVQQELTRRLGEYMYDPHVAVFVEEYRSQQVAVVGAVERPGLVTLRNRQSSVLDAISAAGGLTGAAGGRIYLIPGEGRGHATAGLLADALAATEGFPAAAMNDFASVSGRSSSDALPLMLDSNEVPQGVEGLFLSLPVRAGDVIMVPSSGHFIIEGWVVKPGTYPVRSGLTLRGALATSGGLTFPAKRSRIRIHRRGPDGEARADEVNYSDIAAQRTPDVFVHEGDVIEVASSAIKLVPYSMYRAVTEVLRVGARIPVVP